MRLVALLLGLIVVGLGVVVLRTNVFQPPPADERLSGVSVAVAATRSTRTVTGRIGSTCR
jgi:hypothetical protein